MNQRSPRRSAFYTRLTLLGVLVLCALLCLLWEDALFLVQFERLGPNAQGLAEYRHRRSGIVLVALRGGTFRMGASKEDETILLDKNHPGWAQQLETERPARTVSVRPFLLGKYEVTQAEWTRIMGENPSHFSGESRPVDSVSWEDCQRFCSATGFSLPTEAQWEYACRGGTSGLFGGTGDLDDMGWYSQNGADRTHDIGTRAPNTYGLHDLHGNVYEWCHDWYREDYQAAGTVDPVGDDPESGMRVLRGGGWPRPEEFCRSAFRVGDFPSTKTHNAGFRVMKTLP